MEFTQKQKDLLKNFKCKSRTRKRFWTIRHFTRESGQTDGTSQGNKQATKIS